MNFIKNACSPEVMLIFLSGQYHVACSGVGSLNNLIVPNTPPPPSSRRNKNIVHKAV